MYSATEAHYTQTRLSNWRQIRALLSAVQWLLSAQCAQGERGVSGSARSARLVAGTGGAVDGQVGRFPRLARRWLCATRPL